MEGYGQGFIMNGELIGGASEEESASNGELTDDKGERRQQLKEEEESEEEEEGYDSYEEEEEEEEEDEEDGTFLTMLLAEKKTRPFSPIQNKEEEEEEEEEAYDPSEQEFDLDDLVMGEEVNTTKPKKPKKRKSKGEREQRPERSRADLEKMSDHFYAQIDSFLSSSAPSLPPEAHGTSSRKRGSKKKKKGGSSLPRLVEDGRRPGARPTSLQPPAPTPSTSVDKQVLVNQAFQYVQEVSKKHALDQLGGGGLERESGFVVRSQSGEGERRRRQLSRSESSRAELTHRQDSMQQARKTSLPPLQTSSHSQRSQRSQRSQKVQKVQKVQKQVYGGLEGGRSKSHPYLQQRERQQRNDRRVKKKEQAARRKKEKQQRLESNWDSDRRRRRTLTGMPREDFDRLLRNFQEGIGLRKLKGQLAETEKSLHDSESFLRNAISSWGY